MLLLLKYLSHCKEVLTRGGCEAWACTAACPQLSQHVIGCHPQLLSNQQNYVSTYMGRSISWCCQHSECERFSWPARVVPLLAVCSAASASLGNWAERQQRRQRCKQCPISLSQSSSCQARLATTIQLSTGLSRRVCVRLRPSPPSHSYVLAALGSCLSGWRRERF